MISYRLDVVEQVGPEVTRLRYRLRRSWEASPAALKDICCSGEFLVIPCEKGVRFIPKSRILYFEIVQVGEKLESAELVETWDI